MDLILITSTASFFPHRGQWEETSSNICETTIPVFNVFVSGAFPAHTFFIANGGVFCKLFMKQIIFSNRAARRFPQKKERADFIPPSLQLLLQPELKAPRYFTFCFLLTTPYFLPAYRQAGSLSLIHPAHTAAGRHHRSRFFFFREIRNKAFRRKKQPCYRSRVLYG